MVMLEVGTVVPDIALEDTDGQPVRLADYRDRLNVLVYFMRSATCPVCNRHVKNLAENQAAYAARHVQILVAIPEGRFVLDRGMSQRTYRAHSGAECSVRTARTVVQSATPVRTRPSQGEMCTIALGVDVTH